MTEILSRPAFSVATRLMEKAAEMYQMDPFDLPRLGANRMDFKPRFAVVWALRQLHDEAKAQGWPPLYSYQRIGRLLGYTDHTTGLYAYRRATKIRECDPHFTDLTDRLLAYARTIGPQVVAKAA